MSKAEERALEHFPNEDNNSLKGRFGFLLGYHQAEKDLEMTLDDINIIINAFLDFKIESVESGKDKKYTDEEYCKEVLKRFKERKEK